MKSWLTQQLKFRQVYCFKGIIFILAYFRCHSEERRMGNSAFTYSRVYKMKRNRSSNIIYHVIWVTDFCITKQPNAKQFKDWLFFMALWVVSTGLIHGTQSPHGSWPSGARCPTMKNTSRMSAASASTAGTHAPCNVSSKLFTWSWKFQEGKSEILKPS